MKKTIAIVGALDTKGQEFAFLKSEIEKRGCATLVICHGGPFDEPENVGKALLKMPGIAGFYGASSAERLPTERAITAQTEAVKALKLA